MRKGQMVRLTRAILVTQDAQGPRVTPGPVRVVALGKTAYGTRYVTVTDEVHTVNVARQHLKEMR